MKKLLIIATAAFMLANAYGQEIDSLYNFYRNDVTITWEKKYPCDKSFSEVYSLLKISGEFVNIDTVAGKFFGDMKPFEGDYKGTGFTLMNAPTLVTNNMVNGFAVISLKDSVLNIVIKKIILERSFSIGRPGDLLSFEKGEKSKIEIFAINSKKKFRGSFTDAAKILDYTYNKKFTEIVQ